VVQRQRRPLAVASQSSSVALGQEPLKTAQRSGQWLTVHKVQRITHERGGVVGREPTGPGDQVVKNLYVAREVVGGVQTR
jgi:hypothetical protein